MLSGFWRYVMYGLLIVLLAFVVGFIIGFLGGIAGKIVKAAGLTHPWVVAAVTFGPAFVLGTAAALRFSLALPAAALGVTSFGPTDAWYISKGCVLRMLAVILSANLLAAPIFIAAFLVALLAISGNAALVALSNLLWGMGQICVFFLTLSCFSLCYQTMLDRIERPV